MPRRFLLLAAILVPLAGCDQLGLESATVTAARVEADGKAVGAACRHGGRAIEDCFTLNRKTDKAAIYAGWREMDDYMRENKIEAVAPTMTPAQKPARTAGGDDASSDDGDAKADASPDQPAGNSADKPADKVAKADKPAKAEKPARPVAQKPVAVAKAAAADPGQKASEPH